MSNIYGYIKKSELPNTQTAQFLDLVTPLNLLIDKGTKVAEGCLDNFQSSLTKYVGDEVVPYLDEQLAHGNSLEAFVQTW